MERGWPKFGEAIRRARLATKLSQEQLAEASGVHWTNLSEIESSKVSPSINVLRRIADGLGVRAWQIVHDAEVMMIE